MFSDTPARIRFRTADRQVPFEVVQSHTLTLEESRHTHTRAPEMTLHRRKQHRACHSDLLVEEREARHHRDREGQGYSSTATREI